MRGMKGLGPNQQKILLLLMTLGTLSFTHSSRTYFQSLKGTVRAWREINRRTIDKSIRSLYQSRLIDIREDSAGVTRMTLTKGGKKQAISFKYETMGIEKPARWDKIWRVVLSDIPERHKSARDTLRRKLQVLGFYEFQKSVFVHPYPCDHQLNFLIENFQLRPYVRVLEASRIDNELHLKKIFGLL